MSSAYRQNPTTFPLRQGYLNPMSVSHFCKLLAWKEAVVAVLVSYPTSLQPRAPPPPNHHSHTISL
ncbi:hypothetical protein BDP81DRAFT_426182 [Colletotrichum phormii]|uniref:Uncharacterized protein n=1 Tax=Colletotrichum phormii TaxID=359342 RepID=A0AAJ0EGB0_9PEZI|nr:uncharacterized protein BDP81DRAFT_426182 [Colletotrichum phormii]KAK1637928.1 hypothetical protein BDP81DRAFT_426182 [Colletotrichum phormii]